MKIAPRDIDGYIRQPHPSAAALIYGTDAGQVRQRAAQLAESWLGANADSMARLECSADQLKDDGALLSDELAAMSLMAPKRVITVREVEDANLDTIVNALTTRAPENFLILYATESLPATSKLRVWAERSAAVGALACYKDEGSGLEQFIRDTLRGYGLRAGSDVTRMLAAQLSGDRQIILNEIEKLSLYVGDEAEEIFLDDVIAAVGENNDRSFDDLTTAVAGGDMVTLCRLSDRLLMEGQPGLLIVRSLMRYFQRLETIALKRSEGSSIDAAIEGLRPPVFFKAKAALKSHAARWSAEACATALARLQILELDSKRYSDESLTRMAHGLMDVARLARATHGGASPHR
ncbi:MAG: DNA polymerase III subunit delta [Pseudomonadota bacterium]